MRHLLAPILVLAFTACSHSNSPAPNPPVNPGGPANPTNADTATAVTAGTDSTYWQVISNAGGPGFNDIWFTDTLHGFAAGWDGNIYASADGGATWAKGAAVEADNQAPGLEMLYFLNATTGYVIGKAHFAYTINGGQSWTVKPRTDLQPKYWPNMQFITPSTGYYASGAACYRTVDTGNTWLPVEKDSVGSLSFINPTTGFIFSFPNKISQTNDGGNNWLSPGVLPNSSLGGGFTLLQFIDAQLGWHIDLAHVSITTNGGVGWKSVFQPASGDVIQDLQVLSGQTTYLATAGHLFKTMDGGATWLREYTTTVVQQSIGTSSAFISLFFTDVHNGWACSSNGRILRYRH